MRGESNMQPDMQRPVMEHDYTFVRHGRSRRTFAVLVAIYAICAAAIVWIDAAWWIATILTLPTIPAILDLWVNPKFGVHLTPTRLDWHTGARQGSIALDEIDHIRFDTRWDFSVRVTVILNDAKRVRLPYQSLPPHTRFESELQARGVPVKRFHFVIF